MKIRFVGLLALLLTVLGMTIGAAAQDAAQPCKAADVLDVEYQGAVQRDWIATMMATLTKTAETDNMTDWLSAATELRTVLARLDANCRGLHFTSEANGGLSAVIGPVSIPDGIWKVSLLSDGSYESVKMTSVDGECYDVISTILTTADDISKNPLQKVLKTTGGCQGLIEVTQLDGTMWDLIFEPVKLTGK